MATPSGGSTPIEGRFGRFQINGSNANVEQWTAEVQTDRVEAIGLEDQSITTGRLSQIIVDGVDKCAVNLKGYVDFDNMPQGVYGIVQGALLTNLILQLRKGDVTRQFTLPYAKVLRVNYQIQIKDKIMFDCNAENSGPFAGPGGTVAVDALGIFNSGEGLHGGDWRSPPNW